MNNDCVLDASALVKALVGREAAADALRQRLGSWRLHAPHLIDAEVGNVLRRLERGGLVSADEARSGLNVGSRLIDHRYPHAGTLAADAWARRHNLSFYDALYVALASRLDISLVTADARLSRAPGLGCRVDLV